MGRTFLVGVAAVVAAVGTVSLFAAATPPGGQSAVDDHFRSGGDCALCHSVSPGAHAMRSPTGEDVSPHGLWQGTMMANSFRDPYFHAQLQKETASQGPAVQELCLRCHAPMAHHGRVLAGGAAPRLADVQDEPLADDGVSCTICHQIEADGLGEERTFSGRPVVGTKRQIYGPFADVATGPMRANVQYTPMQGLHVRRSALCGSCHTLVTEHQGVPFVEQSPYLEWRNSDFTDENGPNDSSRTCQQCHMPEVGATRIARNPMGSDFVIPVRAGYAAHAFVGGNAFMLDLLRKHREELGVTASVEALARTAAATRRQLAESTLQLRIGELERRDGKLHFAVELENLTGHKFPTGYPSRRAWLHVQVRSGQQVVFESGGYDDAGRLVGVRDEFAIPHPSLIDDPRQVAVFEMVAAGPDGAPTTHLTHMQKRLKDTRLLPKGWRRSGPHAEETSPVGIGNDLDFVAGGDTVAFVVPLPENTRGRLRVIAWVHYQTIPPAWVDALRDVDAEACRTFVRLYDAADKQPETVAVALRNG